MPYIPQEDRNRLVPFGDPPSKGYPKHKGELNYVITQLMIEYVLDKGKSYQAISDAVAAANDAAAEFRRRVLDPYEDTCIERNGDVYEDILYKI